MKSKIQFNILESGEPTIKINVVEAVYDDDDVRDKLACKLVKSFLNNSDDVGFAIVTQDSSPDNLERNIVHITKLSDKNRNIFGPLPWKDFNTLYEIICDEKRKRDAYMKVSTETSPVLIIRENID